MNHSENCRAKSDILYFLTVEPLGRMSCCTAQQLFTCAQAGLQPPGHSYTLGTEETVKWSNNFKQTAPGRLLSLPLVIQQRINALLPVSCPGHITLGVTWSDFGSREQTCALTLLGHSCSPSSFRRSPLARFCPKHPWMVQILHPGIDEFSMSPGPSSSCCTSTEKLRAAEALEQLLRDCVKSFHLKPVTHSYHIWLQVFMNTRDFF